MKNCQQPNLRDEELKAILGGDQYKRKSWEIKLQCWWLYRPKATKVRTQGLPKSGTLIPFRLKHWKASLPKSRWNTVSHTKLLPNVVITGMFRETQPQESRDCIISKATEGRKWNAINDQSTRNQENEGKTKYRRGKTNTKLKIRRWI